MRNMLFALAILVVVLCVSCHPKPDPHFVTCYLPGAQLVQSSDGPQYRPFIEFDAAEDPKLDGDVEVVVTSGQTVHLHVGEATCFSIPSGTIPAPRTQAPQFPKVASDAGPEKK